MVPSSTGGRHASAPLALSRALAIWPAVGVKVQVYSAVLTHSAEQRRPVSTLAFITRSANASCMRLTCPASTSPGKRVIVNQVSATPIMGCRARPPSVGSRTTRAARDRCSAPGRVLLALLREGHIVNRILARSALTPEGIRKDTEDRTGPREKIQGAVEIPFSLETKRVLQGAADEADRLSHHEITTEHLLLAILQGRRSLVSTILTTSRIQPLALRAEMLKTIEMTPVGSTAAWVAASRALETESANPLFSDPFARELRGRCRLCPADFALDRTHPDEWHGPGAVFCHPDQVSGRRAAGGRARLVLHAGRRPGGGTGYAGVSTRDGRNVWSCSRSIATTSSITRRACSSG